jgi:hypothetical protein
MNGMLPRVPIAISIVGLPLALAVPCIVRGACVDEAHRESFIVLVVDDCGDLGRAGPVSFHFALTLGALVLHVGYPVDNLVMVRQIGDQRSAGDVGYLAPAVGDDDSRAGDTDHAVPRDDALRVMPHQRPDFRGDPGGVAPECSVGVRSWKRDQHEVPALPDRRIGNGLALEIRHVKVRNEIAWSEHVGPDW